MDKPFMGYFVSNQQFSYSLVLMQTLPRNIRISRILAVERAISLPSRTREIDSAGGDRFGRFSVARDCTYKTFGTQPHIMLP